MSSRHPYTAVGHQDAEMTGPWTADVPALPPPSRRRRILAIASLVCVACALIFAASQPGVTSRSLDWIKSLPSTQQPASLAQEPAAYATEWATARRMAELAVSEDVPKPPYKLVMCRMFRDESRYLKEWILYHYLMGVDHFYLFDHNSTDRPDEVVQAYIRAGLVTLAPAPEGIPFPRVDEEVHHLCMNGTVTGDDAEWMSTIDLDEVLCADFKYAPKETLRPTPLQRRLDQMSANGRAVVQVPRLILTANGYTDPPSPDADDGSSSQIDAFNERLLGSMGGNKPIVRLGRLDLSVAWLQHWVKPKDGWSIVNGLDQELEVQTDPTNIRSLPRTPLFIAHYLTRSLAECRARATMPGRNECVHPSAYPLDPG